MINSLIYQRYATLGENSFGIRKLGFEDANCNGKGPIGIEHYDN